MAFYRVDITWSGEAVTNLVNRDDLTSWSGVISEQALEIVVNAVVTPDKLTQGQSLSEPAVVQSVTPSINGSMSVFSQYDGSMSINSFYSGFMSVF